MTMSSMIQIARVAPTLRATYGNAPLYRAIYLAVISGLIPATRERGRWYIAEGDLPTVARHFGLTP